MHLFKKMKTVFRGEMTGAEVKPTAREAETFDPVLYSLETPKPQQIVFGEANRFSGWIVYFGRKVVAALEIHQAQCCLGHFSVCLPREDVAAHLAVIPAAQSCGFSFSVVIKEAEPLVFTVLYGDGSIEELFRYDISAVKQQQEQWRAWKDSLADLPQPSSELVYLTQGITNIAEYQNSILPAVMTMQNYLVAAGVPLASLNRIFDFGCGSGRLLLGWYIMQPEILCYGCDINQRLIGWAKKYLPSAIRFNSGQLAPPTAYTTADFDLVYAISVLTHLSIPLQRQWIEEWHRILRPGGYLLVTLHGPLYAHLAFQGAPDRYKAFIKSGYAVIGDEEGSNYLATFHGREFVEQLFSGFRLLAHYPQGRIGTQRIIFSVAHMQDLYILQRSEG